MRHLAMAALLALATGGCGEEPARNSQTPAIKMVNPHHEQLLALPGELQRLGVMRAIRDNGKRCQRVEAARYQQDYQNMVMWVALCNDGRHWALFIAPNGDTQVRECAHARQLRLPQCRPVTGPGAAPATAG
ncbi:MAG: hypothetical protein M3177_09280 [Pseudomonadota bacterium]|nr:hypothetical protein [Pseudomonadota bacterium]